MRQEICQEMPDSDKKEGEKKMEESEMEIDHQNTVYFSHPPGLMIGGNEFWGSALMRQEWYAEDSWIAETRWNLRVVPITSTEKAT